MDIEVAMKHGKWLVFFFILVGCNSSNDHCKTNEKEHPCNFVTEQAALKIQNDIGLIPIGWDTQISKGAKELQLTFNWYSPLEVQEIREKVVDAIEIFCNTVNTNEEMKSHLTDFAFGPKNAQLDLYLYSGSDFSFVPTGKVTVVTAMRGMLYYFVHDQNANLVLLFKESFNEALVKLNRTVEVHSRHPLDF